MFLCMHPCSLVSFATSNIHMTHWNKHRKSNRINFGPLLICTIYLWSYVGVYVCINVCLYVCMYVWMHAWLCKYVRACVLVSIHWCVYILACFNEVCEHSTIAKLRMSLCVYMQLRLSGWLELQYVTTTQIGHGRCSSDRMYPLYI